MASSSSSVKAVRLVVISFVVLPTIAMPSAAPRSGVPPLNDPILAEQTRAIPGMLELRNTRWERVRVEVRVGQSQNCEENSGQGSSVLRRDQSWAVLSEEVVCWRRERVPGDPSAGWTAWEQSQLAPDQVRNVTL